MVGKVSVIYLILAASLSGCASQMEALKNVGKEPPLEKVSIPMEKRGYEPLDWKYQDDISPSPYVNSLWQQGARDFFKDMKARRVGDILKVTVRIQDKAELENSTVRTRTNTESAAAPRIFGMENKILGMLPGVADPSNLLSTSGNSNSSGDGTIERKETIETQIAAMVTQILPNGNLVIHGDQEVRINFEVRKITIDGIVRQEDISAINTIDSNQIAEARITYGGRGQISNVQQPRIGNQLIDILSPF